MVPPWLIEGGSDGTSSTEPDTSGERTQTPYMQDGQFFTGPDSEFQLELRDNTFWCFGEADTIYTGVCDLTPANTCLSNADCGIGETCVSGAAAVDGNGGKIHHDRASSRTWPSTTSTWTARPPTPIRDITRIPNPDPTRPDPVIAVGPAPHSGRPAARDRRQAPADGFFEQANFRGAFGDINWPRAGRPPTASATSPTTRSCRSRAT